MIRLKRFFFVLFCLYLYLSANAQIRTTAYYDGNWTSWSAPFLNLGIRGGYAGFTIGDTFGGWDPLVKFTIDNFYIPDKETRKQRVKSNTWYEYTGTVEYYIDDDAPSAYVCFKRWRSATFVSQMYHENRGIKKIVSRARIRIAPYKDHPKVYTIFYDNVGLGIDLNTVYFK